jgi:hypothetical protein
MDHKLGSGVTSAAAQWPYPWPYRAELPQRYAVNYARYRSGGGALDLPDDVRGFIAGMEGNEGDMARFYFFCLLFDQLMKEGIRGDVAELGVYKGNTGSLLARFARRIGRTAYLLDTFEGFNEADLIGVDANSRVEFTDTSLEAVRELVGEESVRYIKGYFPESTSQLSDDLSFCLVHLDCDLYAPILSALKYFYPRLIPGGFLIVHDYSSLHWKGAEKAVDEFFADKTESIVMLPDGAGSAVIRKAKRPDRYSNWLVKKMNEILNNEWVDVSNGLFDLLGRGWSEPEKWGVWGVGETHELKLFFPAPQTSDVRLDADVHVYTWPGREPKVVDVFVEEHRLATWTFTDEENRGVRTVQIPARIILQYACQDLPAVPVEFRPRSPEKPNLVDHSKLDTRPLGLAVHRISRMLEQPQDSRNILSRV